MCWNLGRQGSSGKGSWENTESSPEEQELRVSGKLGEYCSVGAHRSRYSCRQAQRNERVVWDNLHSDTSSFATKGKDTSKEWEAKDVKQTEEHKFHAETQSKKNRDFPEEGERGGGEEYHRHYDVSLIHTKSSWRDSWNRTEKYVTKWILYEEYVIHSVLD